MGRLSTSVSLDDSSRDSGVGGGLATDSSGSDEGGQGLHLGWGGCQGQLDEECGERGLGERERGFAGMWAGFFSSSIVEHSGPPKALLWVYGQKYVPIEFFSDNPSPSITTITLSSTSSCHQHATLTSIELLSRPCRAIRDCCFRTLRLLAAHGQTTGRS